MSELERYRSNLKKLREREASYGVLEVPLHLTNEIEAHEQKIKELEQAAMSGGAGSLSLTAVQPGKPPSRLRVASVSAIAGGGGMIILGVLPAFLGYGVTSVAMLIIGLVLIVGGIVVVSIAQSLGMW